MEIWKDIEGYNGKYQISNYGNVRSFSKWKNGENLKFGYVALGYPAVRLVKNGRKEVHQEVVHRLVAKYFVENPNGYNEVNHIDGNKENNRYDNLEWCSHQHNINHAIANRLIVQPKGRYAKNSKPVYQKDLHGNIIKEWESVNQVQRETGYSASNIFCCCNKRKHYKTAYGFIWEYKE